MAGRFLRPRYSKEAIVRAVFAQVQAAVIRRLGRLSVGFGDVEHGIDQRVLFGVLVGVLLLGSAMLIVVFQVE